MVREGAWKQLYDLTAKAATPTTPSGPGPSETEAGLREDTVKRTKSLYKKGLKSKAVRNLTSTLSWKSDESVLQQLRDLHPDSGEDLSRFDDTAPGGEYDTGDLFDIDVDKLGRTIEKTPRYSMPGPSGRRYEHIKLEAREGNLDVILKFVHLCTHTVLPEDLLHYVNRAILLAPTKPQGGVRPLGVRESDSRVIGRLICSQFGEDFQEYFPVEGQFGVCSKNGCEPLIHALQACLEQHPDWDFYLVDYINFFNTCSREEFLQMCYDKYPELYVWVLNCYRYATELVFHYVDAHGIPRVTTILSVDGSTQGDPIGGLLASLALRKTVAKMRSVATHGEAGSYLDDVLIGGPPLEAAEMLELAEVEAKATAKVDINWTKTICLSPRGDFREMDPRIKPRNRLTAGAKYLGIPCGADDYVRAALVGMVQSYSPLLDRLPWLDDHTMEQDLLRLCAHPKFTHAVRAQRPQLTEPAARQHDAAIQEHGARFLGLSAAEIASHPTLELQLELPTARKAGFGFSSIARLAPRAYYSSWKACGALVHSALPRMLDTWDHSPTSPSPSLRAFGDASYDIYCDKCDLEEAAPLSRQQFDAQHPLDLPSCDFPKGEQKSLADGLNRAVARDRDARAETLHAAGVARKRAQTRILSAQGYGALAFLHCASLPGHMLGPILRFLGGVPLPGLEHGTRTCVCGKRMDPLGLHAMCCTKVSHKLTSRHNRIRDTIARLLKELGCTGVKTEQSVFDDPGKRADVVLDHPDGSGRTLALDVVVTLPGGQHPTATHASQPLHAAAEKEKKKHADHDGVTPHNVVFRAFALEAYGAWGQEAETFLRELLRDLYQDADDATSTLGTKAYKRSRVAMHWQREISTALQKGNYQVLADGLRKAKVYTL